MSDQNGGRRHPRYKPELREEAVRLYRELQSVRKVGEQMELSHTRVYALLIEAGELPREAKS